MTLACFRLMAVLTLLAWAPVRAEPTHIQPRLIAESSTPVAGQTVTIALDMRTEMGWHGYWSNPGEAGFAPRLTWHLPKGVTVGPARFPVPQTLVVAGLVNYVFEKDHAILFDVMVPKTAVGTRLPIALDAEWLACTDEFCVPEAGRFTLDLTVGDGTRDAAVAFDGFRRALPRPLGATARYERTGGALRVAIPYPKDAAIADPHFFPATEGLIVDAAPQRFSRNGDQVILDVPQGTGVVGPVTGVLAIGGQQGLMLIAQAGSVPADGTPIGAQASGAMAILLALGGAILGGLILNIMPCVFPIVSLKALSLSRAGESDGKAKREALAYAAGVIATCLALGGVILGRARGREPDWLGIPIAGPAHHIRPAACWRRRSRSIWRAFSSCAALAADRVWSTGAERRGHSGRGSSRRSSRRRARGRSWRRHWGPRSCCPWWLRIGGVCGAGRRARAAVRGDCVPT